MFSWFKRKSLEKHYAENMSKTPARGECEFFYQEWDTEKGDVGEVIDTSQMHSLEKAIEKTQSLDGAYFLDAGFITFGFKAASGDFIEFHTITDTRPRQGFSVIRIDELNIWDEKNTTFDRAKMALELFWRL